MHYFDKSKTYFNALEGWWGRTDATQKLFQFTSKRNIALGWVHKSVKQTCKQAKFRLINLKGAKRRKFFELPGNKCCILSLIGFSFLGPVRQPWARARLGPAFGLARPVRISNRDLLCLNRNHLRTSRPRPIPPKDRDRDQKLFLFQKSCIFSSSDDCFQTFSIFGNPKVPYPYKARFLPVF